MSSPASPLESCPATVTLETLRPLDRAFASLAERLDPRGGRQVELAAALLSKAGRDGHTCLQLDDEPTLRHLAGMEERKLSMPLPETGAWIKQLRASAFVGSPGEFKPLILDEAHRLYFHRLHTYEQKLAQEIGRRVQPGADGDAGPIQAELQALCGRLLPGDEEGTGFQRQAVFTGLTRGFSVITGGPGTGKTFTAARLISAVLELRLSDPGRIGLAASTGKAATRLQENIATPLGAAASSIPGARTLHRLLGVSANGMRQAYHADNRLPYDLLLVDEASMVDLSLMARFFLACPDAARIVLLGDADQLVSVEAGAALSDICRHGEGPGQVAMGGGFVIRLRGSRRAGEETGISELGERVNAGDADAALAMLRDDSLPNLSLGELPSGGELDGFVNGLAGDLFDRCMEVDDPAAALFMLNRFRILTAMRQGQFGAIHFNALVEAQLRRKRTPMNSAFYRGRPILITENDYSSRLFNGDLGVVWPDDKTGHLMAFFSTPEGDTRSVPIGRLPVHETAFSMTVHKSQGSEFEETLLLLPRNTSLVLCRELVYTAITRARKRLRIVGPEPLLREAIARRLRRHTGLVDALDEVSGG